MRATLTLQRHPARGDWRIAGTRLRVYQDLDRWWVVGEDAGSKAWLMERRFLPGPYRTRTDLLNLLSASAREQPLPFTRPPGVKLRQSAPGHYLSECGRVTVERAPGRGRGWWIYGREGWSFKDASHNHAQTLRMASERIARLEFFNWEDEETSS